MPGFLLNARVRRGTKQYLPLVTLRVLEEGESRWMNNL